MPVITSAKSKPEYDVAIVGSGAGGAQMAYTLTLQGLKCVMLEAGRDYVPEVETPMFQAGSHAPLGGSATPEKPFSDRRTHPSHGRPFLTRLRAVCWPSRASAAASSIPWAA